jgi:FK506-binding protein 2
MLTMAAPPLLRLARLIFVLLGLQMVNSLTPSTKPTLSTAKALTTRISPDLRHRRDVLVGAFQSLLGTSSLAVLLTVTPEEVAAAVTDETDAFADNWWSSGKDALADSAATATTTATNTVPQSTTLASDEVIINVSKKDLLSGGLGLELGDIEFRTNRRVIIKSVQENSLASRLNIRKDMVVVALNGQSTERTNAQGVAQMLSTAVRSNTARDTVEFRFRDPSIFRERLQNLSADGEPVTTQVAPAGDTTQRNTDGSVKAGQRVTQQVDQKVTVSQLVSPRVCTLGATTDDLLEISYTGTVLETGAVFDGSAVKINGQGIPGRGNDVSLYFVLGKQPFGQFPPGWDVALVGMCAGERRRLVIPAALAYGSIGVPKRGIPPDATLQYDISLVSLNGISTPK